MKLPQHGRYDYVPLPARRDYDWPGRKRLAFCLTNNMSWNAFGKGRGHDNAKHGEPQTQRNYSWRDYGNRIGVWRLFDLADELGLPLVHNTAAVLYDYAPQIFERIRARGDEIIAHGRTNSENLHDFRWEADEARLIRCNISIHPHTFGYPFRLRPLRRALEHCVSNKFVERVWKCRPGDIADYCLTLEPDIIPGSSSPY